MPQVVTHILLPIILIALFKDWYDSKHKNKFSLRYALIAGLAGTIPDFDIAAFWILHFFGFTIEQVHRTITHSLIIPAIFLALFLITKPMNINSITKQKLQWSIIFLMIAFGTFTHIFLDAMLQGFVTPLLPFSQFEVGLNLFNYLPNVLSKLAAPSLDAALMILWLIYLEFKHKISDFI